MLVISRKEGERVIVTVGDFDLSIDVRKISGNRVQIGLDGPPVFAIRREELPPIKKQQQSEEAACQA